MSTGVDRCSAWRDRSWGHDLQFLVAFSVELKQMAIICNGREESRGYYAKRNKSVRERQLSYDLPDMRNLRNKTEDHREREGEMKQDETREADKP